MRWVLTGLSCFLILGIFWDYWWFVLNPAYGWRGHRRERVPWHPRWYGSWINLDHALGLAVLLLLCSCGQWLLGEQYRRWLVCQCVNFVCVTLLLVAVAPVYHRWRRAQGTTGPLYPLASLPLQLLQGLHRLPMYGGNKATIGPTLLIG